MEYRALTGTGAKVSRLCLGTMTFGGQVTEADAIRMVHRALDLGINFVDTADIYNEGASEIIVGKALQGRRDGVVLLSKVRWQVGPHEWKDQGLSRWHIQRGVEASLKRLQTDCLDVLVLHCPDYDTPLEESLAAADLLVRQGKVLYIGMSNYAAWQVCRAQWLGERHGFAVPVVTQAPYNLLTRGIEAEFVPFCRAQHVAIMAYNPLAAGLLTGKHDPTKAPSQGTRFQLDQEYYGRYWSEANFAWVAELQTIAQQAGKTLVQLALQWLVSRDAVDAVILGASRLNQLEENIAAAEGRLAVQTLAACDEVWKKIKGPSFQYNR